MIQETGVVLLSAIDLCVQFAVHHSSSSKMNLYLKSLDVNCNNFDAVVKLTWNVFCNIWFFIFITHKYHILTMHTTHSLLLEFLRNLISIAICLKMLYHQSRCENFNVLLFLRKVRFQWESCIRCFVLHNCDAPWVNLKAITLSKCYQTQKTTSWENPKMNGRMCIIIMIVKYEWTMEI